MKKILYISVAFLITIGCSKLDQEPQDTVGVDAVFASESGLELYTNSFYNVLPTTSSIIRGDNMADYSARKEVPDFFREGAFGPRQSSGWNWTQLRNINFFIENNSNNTEVPEEIRDHYQGVARFFRSWFYFEKVKRFGDVPWISKPLDVDDPELFKGRDSRELVMDSIMADLDYAINHIKYENDQTRTLITPMVAAAFKSRVALFEGTFRKYHNEYGLEGSADDLFAEAESAAELVMELGDFTLNRSGETPYRDLFTSQSVVSNEIILANAYDEELGILHDANWYYTSSTYGDRLSLTRDFVNTYLNIDGTPFTSNPSYRFREFSEEVTGRDERLKQTIRTPGYERLSGGELINTPPVFSYTYTGYQPIKWVLDDASYDSGALNDNVVPIIRYAEVLLNYAEAKAELGTFTDEDWTKTIGALRSRAGITGGLNTVPSSIDPYFQREYFPGINDPVLLEIRRERGIELALEGFRFYDLVRWAKGELFEKSWNGMFVPELNEPLDLNNDGQEDVVFYQGNPPSQIPGVTYVDVSENLRGSPNPLQLSEGTSGELLWLETLPINWNDKFYLYPIPEDDRLMNPSLGQNPGW